MKIAPLVAAMNRRRADFHSILVHTGQHYDAAMSQASFAIWKCPNLTLILGSVRPVTRCRRRGSSRLSNRWWISEKPDWVVVVGDVNSTMACALVCAKLDVKVAHVEAGLRSRDRTMPEEINRVLTDQIADLLLTPSRDADQNLLAEGIPPERIRMVGNIMIDSLLGNLARAKQSNARADLGLQTKDYAVLTLHRPSNVDEVASFSRILDALEEIATRLPIIFSAHPRTRKMIAELA